MQENMVEDMLKLSICGVRSKIQKPVTVFFAPGVVADFTAVSLQHYVTSLSFFSRDSMCVCDLSLLFLTPAM